VSDSSDVSRYEDDDEDDEEGMDEEIEPEHSALLNDPRNHQHVPQTTEASALGESTASGTDCSRVLGDGTVDVRPLDEMQQSEEKLLLDDPGDDDRDIPPLPSRSPSAPHLRAIVKKIG